MSATLLATRPTNQLTQEEWGVITGYATEPAAAAGAFAESIVVIVMGLLWICGYMSLLLVRRVAREGRRRPMETRASPSSAPQRSQHPEMVEVAPGTRGSGDLSVLIAILGEPTSVADSDPVLRGLGSRVGEVILARPISAVPAADGGWDLTNEAAANLLVQAALFVWEPSPRLVLLPGDREDAVARYAAAERTDIVVLAGDPDANAELYRREELWHCTILVPPPIRGRPGPSIDDR